MEPCLQLCASQHDLCCWGRRPTVPIEMFSFCASHAIDFTKYVLGSFFSHAAKTALFISTHDTFYILFKTDTTHYYVMAWKAKHAPLTASGKKPLHFRKTSSGVLTQSSVLQLLQSLDQFQLSCIIQTPLCSIDALKNVQVTTESFNVASLHFDASVPAFVVSPTDFVSPNTLSAPFVMLLNGSSTPDPRLYHSGTQSLWSTLTANKSSLSKLRHGVLLQQTKKRENTSGEFKEQNGVCETKNNYEQFRCEL